MRQCGILMPVSSLPGPYGIGTLGKQAYKFVDFLHHAGQQIWQILPLSPTGYGDSPYQSCSAFAGNPYLIDLDTLISEGLLTQADLDCCKWNEIPTKVDYAALYNNRYVVLRKAYAAFCKKYSGLHHMEQYLPDDWYAFTLKNENWLPDYALYMAGKTAFDMQSWQQWPEAIRKREPEALAEFRAEHADEVGFWTFLQYEFDKQWSALKQYANTNGIRILGDIPIYAAADSADAWTGSHLFECDADGNFARVAGCPPDFYSTTGQLWGNPVYDWNYHRKTGFAWWTQRMRRSLELYDMVRIDHFRGFDTYWAIPAGSENAINGTWEKGPGIELFRTMEAAIGRPLPIIAEDLGELFDSVRQLLRDSGYPGMKVLQFGFSSGSEFLPYNYTRNCVVYPGTHDNTTLTDWWNFTASDAEKAFARSYLHLKDDIDAVPALLDTVLSSVADTAIIPMADWLGLGKEARLNFPGRLGDNWTWRMADDAATESLAHTIRTRCWVYGRATEPDAIPLPAKEPTPDFDANTSGPQKTPSPIVEEQPAHLFSLGKKIQKKKKK